MANSDESMTLKSSSIQGDDYDDDVDDYNWYQQLQQPQPPPPPQPHHHHHLSRLSMMCTRNSTAAAFGGHDYDDDDYDDDDDEVRRFVSRFSIDHGDGDPDAYADHADDEDFSDDEKDHNHHIHSWGHLYSPSDSDDDIKEPLGGCYSLPATPPRRRRSRTNDQQLKVGLVLQKEYASENDAPKDSLIPKTTLKSRRRRGRRRITREIGGQLNNRASSSNTSVALGHNYSYNSSFSYGHGCSGGECESEAGGSTGLVVMTRPKGGSRSLCLDMEEVKACRDLGFELEHDLRTLEINKSSGRLSISGSTNLDTASSGGNSPIANWRISSPGDDPRDVKARIRVWAQAVALASTSSRYA